LFSATSNIIIAYTLGLFFFFSLNRFTFIKQHSVRRDNTIFAGIYLYYFKLYCLKASSYNECISFSDGSVTILEVRYKVSLCQIASDSFDSVSKWQDVNPVSIWNVRARVDCDNITKSDSQVPSDNLIHSDFHVF
jgi:hypothetical protein